MQTEVSDASGARIVLRAYAAFILLCGAAIGIGGVRLLLLGGSFYYAVDGLALVAAGALLWQADRRGALLYAATLLVALAWGLWEAGPDPWALLPRVIVPALVGAWLLAPWTRRALGLAPLPVAGLGAGFLAGIVLLGYAVIASQPAGGANEAASAPPATTPSEWLAFGNSKAGTRYAAIDQLTPANVSRLELAWTFATHAAPRPGGAAALAFEAPPLKVGDTLYTCSPHNIIFAIDAVSGAERWRFDPKADDSGLAFIVCRGIAYHRFADAPEGGPCAERLYMGTIDARLVAIDARGGKRCADFGNHGEINLRDGIGPHPNGFYFVTSPPTISGKVVVTGSYVLDSQATGEPSGVVRAFDLASGQLVWAFDPARPDEPAPLPPGQTYPTGTPNMWSVGSTDEELGLVYLPFGVATPDFFGGLRTPNIERFSNSIVAVDNATGKMRWTFQVVHHDLWDYDVAAQPVLTTVRSNGKDVKVLISISKTGDAFLLNRETGAPVAPVEERAVPQGAVKGDFTAPTQPFSVAMPSFAGPVLSEARTWGITPLDHLWCRIAYASMRYEGRYTPPRLDTSLEMPSNAGGVNWGSVSVDEGRRIMIVNNTMVPSHNQLITREQAIARGMKRTDPGGHGPSLEQFYLGVPMWGTPYGAITNLPFLSPLGVPCVQPPFGTINAVDLDGRKLLWSKPIGLADRLGPWGIPTHLPVTMGLPSLGGSVTTRGGLTFIGSTPDRRIRAYETATGKLLWQHDLPANANANPMTYIGSDGRQYVVIAAGGSAALASNEKNVLVAFAVPRSGDSTAH